MGAKASADAVSEIVGGCPLQAMSRGCSVGGGGPEIAAHTVGKGGRCSVQVRHSLSLAPPKHLVREDGGSSD